MIFLTACRVVLAILMILAYLAFWISLFIFLFWGVYKLIGPISFR
jgi:hypothetical protein